MRTNTYFFMKLGMNVQWHKGQICTRPFVREKSGSLIMHENVHFLGEKKSSKLDRIFSGRMDTRFRKNTLRAIIGENFIKIHVLVLEILSILGYWACPGKSTRKSGKYQNFFSNAPNGSIRKVNHLKTIFEHFQFFLVYYRVLRVQT